MKIGIGLGINRQALGLESRVASFVAKSKGGAWDFSAGSTIFQDVSGTEPAAIDAAIALARPRFAGSAAVDLSQSDETRRPIRKASFALYDGTNDRLEGNAALRALYRNAGHATIGLRFRMVAMATDTVLVFFDGGTSLARLAVSIITTGTVRITLRRLDGDSAIQFNSATGLVTAGQDYTLLASVNYAAGGTGAVSATLDGASVISQSLSGTGPTSDTASTAAFLGNNVALGGSSVRLHRAVLSDVAATAEEATTLRSWLDAAPT